jgi:hypothetical protein
VLTTRAAARLQAKATIILSPGCNSDNQPTYCSPCSGTPPKRIRWHLWLAFVVLAVAVNYAVSISPLSVADMRHYDPIREALS